MAAAKEKKEAKAKVARGRQKQSVEDAEVPIIINPNATSLPTGYRAAFATRLGTKTACAGPRRLCKSSVDAAEESITETIVQLGTRCAACAARPGITTIVATFIHSRLSKTRPGPTRRKQ